MIMKLWPILAFLCFLSIQQVSAFPVMCRVCNQAESLEYCNTVAFCSRDEECYTETVVLPNGRKVYNAGCMAKTTCAGRGPVAVGVGTVNCTQCCEVENLCNERLCGLRKATNLTICNQCDGVSGDPFPPQYPEDCTFRKVCQSDEMCYASTSTHGDSSLRHLSKCMRKATCLQLMHYILTADILRPGVGRRDAQICSVCCGDDMCNKDGCDTIKYRMTKLNAGGYLDLTTMKEIF